MEMVCGLLHTGTRDLLEEMSICQSALEFPFLIAKVLTLRKGEEGLALLLKDE